MNPRKLFRLLLLTRDLPTALCAWRLGIPWLHLERQGKNVVIKGTDIPVTDLPSALPPGLSLHLGQLAPFGFSLQVADQQGKKVILLDTGKVKLWLDDADVTCVAQEVFGTQEYGVQVTKDTIVVDVGMHVATTSLYFAKEPHVRTVVAFEPSSSAIERAERNLAVNTDIAKKIEVRRYALGDENGKAYLRVTPGSAAISEIAQTTNSETAGSDQELVEIRDAEAELQSLLGQTADHQQIILKMDCEGSEREIFRRLSANTLSRIDVILLEWHSPSILSEIQTTLEKSGFSLLVQQKSKDLGMLYAFRQ
jgi:FkbM family methyltransferase